MSAKCFWMEDLNGCSAHSCWLPTRATSESVTPPYEGSCNSRTSGKFKPGGVSAVSPNVPRFPEYKRFAYRGHAVLSTRRGSTNGHSMLNTKANPDENRNHQQSICPILREPSTASAVHLHLSGCKNVVQSCLGGRSVRVNNFETLITVFIITIIVIITIILIV